MKQIIIAAVLVLASAAAQSQQMACVEEPLAEFENTIFEKGYVLAWRGRILPMGISARHYEHPDGRWMMLQDAPPWLDGAGCFISIGEDGEFVENWTPPPVAPAPSAPPELAPPLPKDKGTDPLMGA